MLKQRVITACFLVAFLAVVLLCVPYAGFALAVSLVMVLAAWEWANMAGLSSGVWRAVYAAAMALLMGGLFVSGFHEHHSGVLVVMLLSLVGWLGAAWMLWRYPAVTGWYKVSILLPAGVWLLVPVWLGLLVLQPHAPHSGLVWLVIAVIAAADIGAYFAGRRFGRRKLAVHVSPGKTWEGFFGGLLAASVLGVVVSLFSSPFAGVVPVMVLTAVASVIGDLFESMVKRQCGIKDSSQLLPGHGGVLDRIDGWTAAIPVFALSYLLLVNP